MNKIIIVLVFYFIALYQSFEIKLLSKDLNYYSSNGYCSLFSCRVNITGITNFNLIGPKTVLPDGSTWLLGYNVTEGKGNITVQVVDLNNNNQVSQVIVLSDYECIPIPSDLGASATLIEKSNYYSSSYYFRLTLKNIQKKLLENPSIQIFNNNFNSVSINTLKYRYDYLIYLFEPDYTNLNNYLLSPLSIRVSEINNGSITEIETNFAAIVNKNYLGETKTSFYKSNSCYFIFTNIKNNINNNYFTLFASGVSLRALVVGGNDQDITTLLFRCSDITNEKVNLFISNNSKFNLNYTNTLTLNGNSLNFISNFNSNYNFNLMNSYFTIYYNLQFNQNSDTQFVYYLNSEQLQQKFIDTISIPYGIKSGTTLGSFSYSITYPISKYYQRAIKAGSYLVNITESYPSDSGGLETDTAAPRINSIIFIPLGSSFFTVIMEISDNLSGFLKYTLSGIEFTQSDLVNGTVNNGRYEKVLYIDSLQYQSFGNIMDMAGNEETSQVQFTYYPGVITYENITSVSFLYNDIDTTYLNSPFKNKLFVNFTNSNKDSVSVSMNLDGVSSENSFNTFSNVNKFIGYWDIAAQQFIIDFEIPPRTFSSDKLPYTIYVNGFAFTSEIITTFLPQTSKLRVFSQYADQMPPIISKIQYYPNTPVIIVPSQGIEVSFIVSIDDEYNGLKNGSIKITSEIDPFGYEFNIKPDTSKNFNMYFGIYELKFNISGNCKDQTFNITQATLFDTSNYKSSITSKSYLNPLYLLNTEQNQMKIQCPYSVKADSDIPQLLSFKLDKSSINLSGLESERTIQITFSTADSTSKISLSHLPLIYITDSTFQRYEYTSKLISFTNSIANYTCRVVVPVSFGSSGFIYFSIYKIVDNHLNFAGYSSEDLQANQFDYYVSTRNTFTPIITSSSSFYLKVDSFLTIFGKGFTSDGKYQIDQLNGKGFVNIQKQGEEGTFVYRRLNVASLNITDPFFIRVYLSDDIVSNSFYINPVPFKEPLLCPGEPVCGGSSNGHCVEGSCICIPPWVGEDCKSQTIIKVPSFNNQIPSISNLVLNAETQVTLVCLRELNIFGETINEFSLLEDRNWKLKVISQENYDFLYYSDFINPKDNSKTQFNVSIQYFPTSKNITWAGSQIQLYPSSTKYNFKISQYNFQSQLNYLQVVMAAYIKTNESESCSTQSNSKGNNEDFYKLNVNDVAFLLRFNKLGILDGKLSKISTSLLNTSDISNYNISKYYPKSNDSFVTANIISMNLPLFNKHAEIDPDFSSIIDTRTSNENYLCSKNGGDPKLKGSKLAGIIVGSIVGALILILGVSYLLFIKFKYSAVSIGIIKLVKLNK